MRLCLVRLQKQNKSYGYRLPQRPKRQQQHDEKRKGELHRPDLKSQGAHPHVVLQAKAAASPMEEKKKSVVDGTLEVISD